MGQEAVHEGLMKNMGLGLQIKNSENRENIRGPSWRV